jgi:hypothetical protein
MIYFRRQFYTDLEGGMLIQSKAEQKHPHQKKSFLNTKTNGYELFETPVKNYKQNY